MRATRTDPDNHWVRFANGPRWHAPTAPRPLLLPNLGGSLPNDGFAEELGMSTILDPALLTRPAPSTPRDEHLLGSLARQALGLMAGPVLGPRRTQVNCSVELDSFQLKVLDWAS